MARIDKTMTRQKFENLETLLDSNLAKSLDKVQVPLGPIT